MRREWFWLLAAFLLLLPSAADAQCRKRILVFLDVSGTMVTRSQDSPYQQSLGAIQDLLQQQGLIEGDDVLEIVFFGDTASSLGRVEGREAATSKIHELQNSQPRGDLTTDFRLFLDSLAKALQDKTPYNSQVVLLGSDLVHEKVNARRNEEDLQDWAAVLADKTATLQQIRESAEKTRTSFVFFVPDAPASGAFGSRRPVQDKVWDDLSKALPGVRRVSPRAGRTELARELKSALLVPPQLTISRDEESPKQLAFIVGNPNCYPLRIKSVTVQRVLDDGSTSEPVAFQVPAEEATLGSSGSKEATRVLKRPIPSGAEWETVKALQGSVATEDGPTGFTQGTAGSWLKYRPQQGAVEGNLLFTPVLRLDLELQGHTEEPKTYTLAVRPLNQGDDTAPLASGKFESPKGLSAQQSTVVRIVLPAVRSLRDLAANQAPFRVTIGDGAQLLEEKKDTSEILDDQSASHSNLFLLLASAIAFCAIGLAFFQVKNILGHYPALDPGRRMNVWWWVMAALSLLPAATNFSHVFLLRHFAPSTVDWAAVILSFVILFATLSFAIRSVQKARFGQAVLTSRPPLPLPEYLKRSRRGVWLPWVAGILATAAFAASWYFNRPPVSEKLSRDLNPTQLHVVSD